MRYTIILLIFFSSKTAFCQQQDTAAIIADYNKVMSFTTQPYMYYKTITTMNAQPVINAEDTVSSIGEVYKNGNNIYSQSSEEDMYLQDTLYISINHLQKTIWISKVDTSSAKTVLNSANSITTKLKEALKERYAISKKTVTPSEAELLFTKKNEIPGTSSFMQSDITLKYDTKKMLPKAMQVSIYTQEEVSNEVLQLLKEQAIDEKPLLKSISGQQYFVRTQSFTVKYSDISDTKEKVARIPKWQERLQYNAVTEEFTTRGEWYKDYTITKLF